MKKTKQQIEAELEAAKQVILNLEKELESIPDTSNWHPTNDNLYQTLKDQGVDFYDLKWGDTSQGNLPNGYTIKHYYTEGGGEGDGEEHWVILEISRDGEHHSFWLAPGWYASYDGGTIDWDEIHQVEKYQKLVDDYRAI
jgi:hypothetical protein